MSWDGPAAPQMRDGIALTKDLWFFILSFFSLWKSLMCVDHAEHASSHMRNDEFDSTLLQFVLSSSICRPTDDMRSFSLFCMCVLVWLDSVCACVFVLLKILKKKICSIIDLSPLNLCQFLLFSFSFHALNNLLGNGKLRPHWRPTMSTMMMNSTPFARAPLNVDEDEEPRCVQLTNQHKGAIRFIRKVNSYLFQIPILQPLSIFSVCRDFIAVVRLPKTFYTLLKL